MLFLTSRPPSTGRLFPINGICKNARDVIERKLITITIKLVERSHLMETYEEKDASFITMRHLRALAGKRGYRVLLDGTHLSMICMILSVLIRSPLSSLPSYALIFGYGGYSLSYEEPATVRRERARHHPMWSLRQLHAKQHSYERFFLFLADIAAWVHWSEPL